MTPVLEIRRASKSFGSHRVLHEVSFGVDAGEVHALVGENGAGKSTLMNIISGIHRRDAGEILLNGESIDPTDPWQARQLGISVVFQELSLTPNMTVAQNIFVRREPTSALGLVHWRQLNDDARALFERIGIDISPTELVGNYSVGIQQIIEIAKAISFDAKVLIMDEPTSALSESEVDRLFSIIAELKQQGVAIVFISHKLGEVLRIADRVSVLRDGEMVGVVNPSHSNQDEIIHMMVGRSLGDLYPAKGVVSDEILLEVEGLSHPPLFRDISFSLRRGEILGIAGLVGAGRTEVARAIFGADRYSRGSVKLAGIKLDLKSPRQAIEKGIVYLTEDRKVMGLFLSMTMRDNIVSSALARFTDALGLLKHRAIVNESLRAIKQNDIRPRDDLLSMTSLSGGNQQKSLLAKCLSANPKVLIADEPTRGVDVGAKVKIHQALRDLANRGIGVIVISSELPEVLGLSDRVVVFREGHVSAVLDGDNIAQADVMRYAVQ